MSKSLNVDAEYIANMNCLQPKNAPKKVVAYVECLDDIAFWYSILKDFESNKLRFDVQPVSRADKNSANGKCKVLQKIGDVGDTLILCVDSDFDYLVYEAKLSLPNGLNNKAESINTNKFIFQTYAYSIENLRCFKKSLHLVLCQAVKNHDCDTDFEHWVETYSNIVYPLFVWYLYLWFEKGNFEAFEMATFQSTIETDENDARNNFAMLQTRVDTKLDSFKNQYSTDIDGIESLDKKLSKILKKEDTYLFIQGHFIQNNVIIKWLNAHYKPMKEQYTETIKRNATDGKTIKNLIEGYHNSCTSIKNAVSLNTEFKHTDCQWYQMIKYNLQIYVKSIS